MESRLDLQRTVPGQGRTRSNFGFTPLALSTSGGSRERGKGRGGGGSSSPVAHGLRPRGPQGKGAAVHARESDASTVAAGGMLLDPGHGRGGEESREELDAYMFIVG